MSLPPSPEDMPHAFARAWASRDGAEIGALFSEDAEFVNVVGLWWHARDAIANAHGYALGSFFAETKLRPGATRVKRLSNDHAIVQCRFRLTGQRTPDGRTAAERRTILTFVVERRTNGWIAVAAQNTDVAEGAETLARDRDGALTPTDYRGT
ncbi:SgcJ/EcaC family oxidoreductase [Roseivivax marinus]|uniref:SgcJ/EcaC family oxidoreductase n=1 Tax=Roseivivax marinus TaxID=1379903 RepID=UPI00273E2B0C|nr:SgcJ/EcaC family oxidoreductase [Roseivivax marinus]